MEQSKIIRPGDNCRQWVRTERAALLIDGDAYFRALSSAMRRARHSIMILGWDLHSRMQFRRHAPDDGLPFELAAFINELARRRRSLRVHILIWDWSMIYALERELLPVFRMEWRTPRRVKFHYDDVHPIGASHHQKLVVIDDALAFCGGIDLALHRWDTPAHRPDDPLRVDFHGRPYRPFHDLMLAVDGEAAAQLGRLARERWRLATGKAPPPALKFSDPWPEGLAPDLTGVRVAIARTMPESPEGEVREVEKLYLDAIAQARRSIYIENQYLTSPRIASALAARLEEPDGPEIILVSSGFYRHWLEENSMSTLRGHLLKKIKAADRFDRFRAYYPAYTDPAGVRVFVHSKLMIVDGRFLRVGSSNLSNRSMGLDTECDLAIEAENAGHEKAIAALEQKLLAEHLGVTEPELARAIEASGSLLRAVESLLGGDKTLLPIESKGPEWFLELLPDASFIDPEQAIPLERFVEEQLSETERNPRPAWLLQSAGLLLTLLVLAGAWLFTPVGDWVRLENAWDMIAALRSSPTAGLEVALVFVTAGLVMVPVRMLLVLTGMVFGLPQGLAYGLFGTLVSAAAAFPLGRTVNRGLIRLLAGQALNQLSRRIAMNSILAVATARVLAQAPFMVINLAAGAARMKFRSYLLGTLIGMAPAVIAFTWMGALLAEFIRAPGLNSLRDLVVVSIFLLSVSAYMKRRIGGRQPMFEVKKKSGNLETATSNR